MFPHNAKSSLYLNLPLGIRYALWGMYLLMKINPYFKITAVQVWGSKDVWNWFRLEWVEGGGGGIKASNSGRKVLKWNWNILSRDFPPIWIIFFFIHECDIAHNVEYALQLQYYTTQMHKVLLWKREIFVHPHTFTKNSHFNSAF